MLVILVILGFFLYFGLYYVWSLDQASTYQPFSLHSTVNDMVWMPQSTIFLILRGLLLIAAFYLVADFLYTSARNGVKHKKLLEEEAKNPHTTLQRSAPHQEVDIDTF